MPRRKKKIKFSRKEACKYLEPKGDLSASLQPLCYCSERDLVLGTNAYVCQVCVLYSKTNDRISDLYDDSRKLAEKKLKKQELDELRLKRDEDELDLSTDEFGEEEKELPDKYEKRKLGKSEIEETDEFGGDLECPFCGEIFDDVNTHINECEFAPDDATIEDFIPESKRKKSSKKKGKSTSKSSSKKKKCPHCGKEFSRLGRHLTACKKNPENKK